jgi:hypothetical protein
VLALVLAGCDLGGDDASDAGQGTTTGTTEAAQACPGPKSGSGAELAVSKVFVVKEWRLDSENVNNARGCVYLDGKPVEGVRVRVDRYTVPTPSGADGSFVYPVDSTLAARHVVTVVDADEASVDGTAVDEAGRAELLLAQTGLTVSFKLSGVESRATDEGILVTGRASYGDTEETAPPPVVLFSYQLSGFVRDSDGKPVQGAVVSTRSIDREFWTVSDESAADGSYSSIYYPTGESDPVGFTVRIAVGDDVFEFLPDELIFFERLRSARMDVELPPAGFPLGIPPVETYDGAIYEGLLVGVAEGSKPIKPLSARWLDEQGRFELLLPKEAAGKSVTFWESSLYAFSKTEAKPGEPVDLEGYPTLLTPEMPQDLGALELPG